MKKGGVTKLLFVMIVLLCGSPLVTGQTVESKLAQKVEAFDSEKLSTVEQLVELAQRFQIPMGIEWLDVADERIIRPVHARETTVQNVLRQILQQQSDYDFKLSDGVVHIFAASVIDDPRNFLNLRIPRFQVEKESLTGSSYKLRVSINQLLHPSPGYGGGYGGVSLDKDFDIPKITLSGNNLSVRNILSKTVAMHGNSLWVIGLNPLQMMASEPFCAQIPSTMTGQAAAGFAWKFIALRAIKDEK